MRSLRCLTSMRSPGGYSFAVDRHRLTVKGRLAERCHETYVGDSTADANPRHLGPPGHAMLPRHFIAEQPPKRIVGATIAVARVEQKRQACANNQAGPMSLIFALINRLLKRCQGDKN